MTSSIGLLSVFADVVILLVLAAAVSSPRVSSLARPMIATFAFACAWLITAFDALRAPGWTVSLGVAVIVVSIGLITATLHIWTQEIDGGGNGAGPRPDDGGGGSRQRRPDAPQHGGGGSNPSWWPEFERQLALYVAKRESPSCIIGSAGPVATASAPSLTRLAPTVLCLELRGDNCAGAAAEARRSAEARLAERC